MRPRSVASHLAIAVLAVLVATLGHPLGNRPLRAQPSPMTAGSSARGAYLEVLRTRSDMDQAAAELARADALLARAMLAPSEHEARRAAFARTRLAHLGALLAAEDRAAHLVIERAVKSRTPDGRLRVTLTLRNATEAPQGEMAGTMGPPDSLDVDLAAWRDVRGATVAIKADAGPNGATISRPYEQAVPPLAPGRARTVALELLEDATDVVVAIGAGERMEERRIRLEIASATNAIAVDAAQFSLEGELGAQVLYDLRLERPRPTAAATRLAVRGLPPEVSYELRDPAGNGRLGQLRFADGATTARVQLALALPARPSPALRPDVPLAFEVIAADEGASDASGARSQDGAAPGRARLELVPRGVARVELRPATLGLEARDDGATTLALTVRNAGSGRVDDLRLRADLPTHWQAEYRPATIATLAPGDERRVSLSLHPPRGVAVGDYEIRVGIDAGAARRIDVEDKLVRVRVAGGGGVLGTVLAALAAVGLTALVVAYGRRWVNR